VRSRPHRPIELAPTFRKSGRDNPKPPPVNYLAEALIPTLGCLYGAVDASRAADNDGLLEAPGCITVKAKYIFEKAHAISHGHNPGSPINALALPQPPMGRPKRHGTISTYVAPA
jgi:hypothetical protein